MREMNVILADIVTANGGTVTPPITRNGLLSDWLEAIAPTIIQQVFITLKGGNEYFTFQNPVVEAGEFNHTYDVIVPTNGGYIVADNTPTTGVSRVAIQDDGTLWIASDGGNVWSETVIPEILAIIGDGKFHTIGLRREAGNVMYFSLNGDDILNTTHSGTFTFNSLGAKKGASTGIPFWNDVIANVDLGNGNAWPLDVLTGNTQQAANGNNEITLVNIPTGAPDRELFTKNISTDPDQWENADKSRIIQIA